MAVMNVNARPLQLLGIALIAMLLVSCAGSVRTRLNTFMKPDAEFGQGSIAVKPADASLEGTLEFGFYQQRLAEHLRDAGYTLASAEEADYIARLGYEVEPIEYDEPSPRVVFTTGFGSYYHRGGVGFLMADPDRYEQQYLRQLRLTITRVPDSVGGEAQRVYETTALSEGNCPLMSVVLDEMLAAIFQNFPGENGAVKTVTTRGESRCE